MESSGRKIVLFVDDDVALLELLKELMARFAGDAWEVLTAPDVSKALSLLQQRRIDLLVVDIRMPLVDGLQFLGMLQRKHPSVIKVILTGEATDEHRVACLASGAELFLEKPRDEGGWRTVYAMLNELAKFQPEEGLHAALRRMSLHDVLQMECLARHSAILHVRAGDQQGAVYIKDGQIIHAQYSELIGEAAFKHLLMLEDGEFDLKTFTEPAERSIAGSWEFLLLEGVRTRARQAEPPKESPTDETPFCRNNPTDTPPSLPAVVPIIDSGADDLQDLRLAQTHGRSTNDSAGPPTVEELLICSPQGEVLHEWHCPNTAGRVGLLEYLSGKVGQLGVALPLGEFDRLEASGPGFRVVAQIQPDRASFLRVTRATAAPEVLPAEADPLHP